MSKRSHSPLPRNEACFQQLVEHIQEVFWLTSLDKKEMIYISPGYERIWGRTCQSLYEAPQSWLEAIYPEDRARVLESALTRQDRGEYDQEYRILRPDGTQRWIRDRAFPVLDRDGGVCCIAGLAEDITQTKLQEATALAAAHLQVGLQRVRGEVLMMQAREDWVQVAGTLQQELQTLVPSEGCGIAMVDLRQESFFTYDLSSQGVRKGAVCDFLPRSLEEAVRQQVPVYRCNRAEMTAWGDNVGPERNSVVDVPFAGGTLSLSRAAEHGFGTQDIQILTSFAAALSPAMVRLELLERRNAVEKVRIATWQMVTAADIRQVLAEVVAQLGAIGLPVDNLGVQLVDDSEEVPGVKYYIYKEMAGIWWEEDSRTKMHAPESVAAARQIHQFWQGGRPVYRPDLLAEDLYQERARLERANPGIRALLDVPFAQGTLALNSRQPDPVSPEGLAFLGDLAAVLSESFTRVADLQALERRAREGEALALAIGAVAASNDIEEVLQVVVEQAALLMQCKKVRLLLYDAGEGALVPRAQIGHDWEVYRHVRSLPGRGLSGQVFATGRAQFTNEYPPPEFPPSPAATAATLHTSLAEKVPPEVAARAASVPLVGDGRVVGVLTAAGTARRFTRDDLGLLGRLAQHVVVAIEKAEHAREGAISLALQRVRSEMLTMAGEPGWLALVEVLSRELHVLVPHAWSGFTLVDLAGDSHAVYALTPDGVREWSQSGVPKSLRQTITSGGPAYRRTRAEMAQFGDLNIPPEFNAVVDVPFLGGTVFMNHTQENPFSAGDIALLGRFSQVLSEAYQRLQDLRQLAQTQQQLYQSQKLETVGQLTAGIAHNFNNLLQANLANISLAMMKGSAEVGRYLQEAEEAALRGADLVRQLMLFSRAEKTTLRREPVDLVVLIENTIALGRKTFGPHLELEVAIAADLPLIQGDPGELQQVLLNLYLNGRDALAGVEREHPCLRIGAEVMRAVPPGREQAGDYVQVSVEDNGTGMEEQTRQRVFEPFFTTKEAGAGTGLGLATVYGIVQSHGGWIECRSQAGVGTVFTCHFPAVVGLALQGVNEAGGELLRGTETLLIIDDEELVRRSTGEVLGALGYTVLEAADGLEGLELFRQQGGRVDLVLLDLAMPGLAARMVLAQLKEQNPQVKVILFTGYAPAGGVFAGAEEVLEKPLVAGRLSQVVRRVLDRP